MPDRLQLTIDLDLELGPGPIAGQACCGLDVVRPFQGWLELASVIAQLQSNARAADLTTTKPGGSPDRSAPVPGSRAGKGSGVGD